MTQLRWRLSLDLGTSSLGWCALGLTAEGTPYRILAMVLASSVTAGTPNPVPRSPLIAAPRAPCAVAATA